MKKPEKKRRVLAWMDIAAAVIATTAGVSHFLESRDWVWICWVVIVLCLELRLWVVQDALRREEAMSETWRVLYQKASNQVLDLAWENEQMRVKHSGEDEG